MKISFRISKIKIKFRRPHGTINHTILCHIIINLKKKIRRNQNFPAPWNINHIILDFKIFQKGINIIIIVVIIIKINIVIILVYPDARYESGQTPGLAIILTLPANLFS